jgi:hypothetical protein
MIDKNKKSNSTSNTEQQKKFTMDQLIPIASKLQDVLGAVGQNTQLDLPQIVVVRVLEEGKSRR